MYCQRGWAAINNVVSARFVTFASWPPTYFLSFHQSWATRLNGVTAGRLITRLSIYKASILLQILPKYECLVQDRGTTAADVAYDDSRLWRHGVQAVPHVSYWVRIPSPVVHHQLINCRQHNVVPQDETLRNDITHVVLAFMRSDVFAMHETPTEFPLFTTVDKVRQQFDADTKVMVAIGGWGDSKGFEDGARTPESRRRWATNVKAMIDATGADGVDIDWEYPG